jgi:hypothetical protein
LELVEALVLMELIAYLALLRQLAVGLVVETPTVHKDLRAVLVVVELR